MTTPQAPTTLAHGFFRKASLMVCVITTSFIFLPTAVAQKLTVERLLGRSMSEATAQNFPSVHQAINRYVQKDLAGARQLLKQAKSKNSKLPPAELLIAEMHLLRGLEAAAVQSLDLVAREHPEDPKPYIHLGAMAFKANQNLVANVMFHKAIELTEKFKGNAKRKRQFVIRANAGLAAVAERRKEWSTALIYLKPWLNTAPDDPNALYRYATSLFMSGKEKEAVAYFKKAYELSKNNKQINIANPYLAVASLYQNQGNVEKARKAFSTAVSANKNDLNTLISAAMWNLRNQNIARAEKLLTEARRVDSESINTLLLSGVTAAIQKKHKPAEDYLHRVLQRSPANSDALNMLAMILAQQPDNAKQQLALDYARLHTQIKPKFAEARITLASILYNLRGRNPALAQQANLALNGVNINTLSPDGTYLLAMIMKDKEPARAKKLLDKALADKLSISIFREDARKLRDSL